MPKRPAHSQIEISLSLQASFLVLYMTGGFCALWGKGYSPLTFAVLGAAPIAMLLSRIPKKWFPELLRQLVQLGIGAAAIAWFKHRAPDNPLDLALIECAAVIGVALLVGGVLREHSLLAILSIALAGYGGLTPGRAFYFPAFSLAAAVSVTILYQTRMLALTAGGQTTPLAKPRSAWEYRIFHFAVVVFLVMVCLAQFPLREKLRTRGIAPVSFNSEQDLEFPELWRDWFKPTKYILTQGKTKHETDGADNPALTDKPSKFHVSTNDPKTMSARDGGGGGAAMGTDLVFRAYSPAKLYWVMQIYDTYDGDTWSRSPILLAGKNSLDTYEPQDSMEIIQNISLEKPLGLRLPYAHKLKQAGLRNRSNRAEDPIRAIMQRPDAVSLILKSSNIPEPPWHYRVQSYVPIPDLRLEPKAWQEPPRNFGWNCRSLPPKVITPRLRQLALDLTANADTPMAKADALRDYLRRNFKYNLETPPIPDDREVVDYFLFESREGYCQHYAQALVILARLAGLHSRLVTGYSPGKYNVLANYFEVYEYHAHAWTQIFIEPYGWLTYDGVPPGDLRLQDGPNILQSFLDPFGDTWGDRPPELSYKPPQGYVSVKTTQKKLQEKTNASTKSTEETTAADKKISRTEALYDEIMTKAVLDNNTTEPDLNQIAKAAVEVIKKRLSDSFNQMLASAKASVLGLYNRTISAIKASLAWLHRLTIADYLIGAVILAVTAGLWNSRRAIRSWVKVLWRRFCCRRLWRKIASGTMPPEAEISCCQQLVNDLMNLAHFHRPPQVDLLERADFIPLAGISLCEDYRIIAQAAATTWYSRRLPDAAAAEAVREATRRFSLKIKAIMKKH